MRAEASHEAPLDDNEPIGLLRANEPGQAERILPLFKRPAEIVVGRAASCDWRFERFDGEPLPLSWDGVRLKVGGRKIKPDEIVVTDGGLEIVFELLLFSEEVTQIRKMPLPPAASATPAQTSEPDARTVIEVQLSEAPPQPSLNSEIGRSRGKPETREDRWRSEEPSPLAAPRPAEPTAPPRPWRCFVPPRNGAADDEPTIEWPIGDALAPTADLLDRLGRWSLRRLPRKKIAIYAALAVVVAVEVTLLVRPHKPAPGPSASASRFASDVATPPPERTMQPDKDLELSLKEGIRAYRAGRTADALDRFGRLEQATGEPAARLMLFILRTRGAATP